MADVKVNDFASAIALDAQPGDRVKIPGLHGAPPLILRYVKAGEALALGDWVRGTLAFSITGANNITMAVDGTTFTVSTASTFTKEVRDKDGLITTYSSPLPGSIIHVNTGTGDQQTAIVKQVVSATVLEVWVITSDDGKWATASDATTEAYIVTPYRAMLTDTDDSGDGSYPTIGVVRYALASGEYGWICEEGIVPAKVAGTAADAKLKVGATAGVAAEESATYSATLETIGKVIVPASSSGELALVKVMCGS